MENKPLHFDGSVKIDDSFENEANNNEEFKITDEIRKNISGNPYSNN